MNSSCAALPQLNSHQHKFFTCSSSHRIYISTTFTHHSSPTSYCRCMQLTQDQTGDFCLLKVTIQRLSISKVHTLLQELKLNEKHNERQIQTKPTKEHATLIWKVQFSQSVTKDLWEIMKCGSVGSGQIKVSTAEGNKDQLIDWWLFYCLRGNLFPQSKHCTYLETQVHIHTKTHINTNILSFMCMHIYKYIHTNVNEWCTGTGQNNENTRQCND